MIHIRRPQLVSTEMYSSVVCDVEIDNVVHSIWFRTDKKYEQYLCVERSDAYLIGLLNYAQRRYHDIICDAPVTEDLLYNIETDLLPSLCRYGKNMHKPKIIAQTAPPLQQGFAVGTGASFGVDSFSAIVNHVNSPYSSHNITHLCINDVGAFNECYGEYGQDKVKEERYVIAQKIADELGMELIKTDSNFANEIPQIHLVTHTYSSCFAIYMLQKLWRTYYYGSSGFDYSHFSLVNHQKKAPSYYELLSLQCFSIPGLRIYSEGGAKTRLDKMMEIANYPPAQKHVHVCILKPYNCGVCEKCMRTLVTLDLLDVLDQFGDSFDIEYYKANRKKYLAWLCDMHFFRDVMNEPVYRAFLKKEGFRSFAYRRFVFNVFMIPFYMVRKVYRKIIPISPQVITISGSCIIIREICYSCFFTLNRIFLF